MSHCTSLTILNENLLKVDRPQGRFHLKKREREFYWATRKERIPSNIPKEVDQFFSFFKNCISC
jgi:hypothetical protein